MKKLPLKKTLLLALLLLLALTLCACGGEKDPQSTAQPGAEPKGPDAALASTSEQPDGGETNTPSESKTLVVYFSHAGENYNVGVIEEGNTAKMAKLIAGQLDAELFEIVPLTAYPTDYNGCLEVATEEQRTNACPGYVGDAANWEQYSTVFVGYPIWWGDMPNIVYSFLEAHDFAGKTVIPFNTHEGSGQAGTQRTIEGLMHNAAVLKGLALRGSKAQNDAEGSLQDVKGWLTGLGLLKP